MASRLINEDVVSLWNQAGIDMKTGKPSRMIESGILKKEIKKLIRIQDEQDAVNRYQWFNVPMNLSSQEIERFLYYRGQLCFFYFEEIGQFIFAPYALDGSIDFYGRYNVVKPVPIADGTSDEKTLARQRALLSTKSLKVLYDVPDMDLEDPDPTHYCVLLSDYTKQWGQTTIPRQQLNDELIDLESDLLPFLRTTLLNATGVNGMKVSNADEYSNVKAASRSVNKAAIDGEKWIPISATLELQELAATGNGKAEEFLMTLQAIDNYRLSTHGIPNGGVYSKNQYQNTMQTAMNAGAAVGSPLQDGLSIRQRFCDIVNYLFGCGMSCELSEQCVNTDLSGDGYAFDDKNQGGFQGDQANTPTGGTV